MLLPAAFPCEGLPFSNFTLSSMASTFLGPSIRPQRFHLVKGQSGILRYQIGREAPSQHPTYNEGDALDFASSLPLASPLAMPLASLLATMLLT